MYWRLLFMLTLPVLLTGAGRHQGSPEPGVVVLLQLPAGELQRKSVTYTLENGGKSLAARLWLLDNARRTIDIQYYSFARNVTGLIACEHVVRAADRGVKVRILVDDAAGRMNNYELKVLNAHDNIEIRVYNAGLKVGKLDKRVKKLGENHNRVLRRMHNKLLLIDGEAAITGGRNVSDEYFDYGKKYNFRDRDILFFGKATKQAGESFEEFWNDSLAVAVETLSGKKPNGFSSGALFGKMKKLLNDTGEHAPALREHARSFPREFEGARTAGRVHLEEDVAYVSDVPGKNEARPGRKGGRTTDTIVALIRSARFSVDIQSPYFITTSEMKDLIRETVARGVKVRVLTNSLASTDNHEAFSGYQRDRKENLATGVKLYEFRPDPAVRFTLSVPDIQAGLHYKAVYGLHSKSMIVDGHISVTGSYNLDPRSANLNTESIVVVRSRKAAEDLAEFFTEEFQPRNSWPVTEHYNPDKEASLKKRFKAFTRRLIPKRIL